MDNSIKLSENQKRWIGWMLHGMGLSAAKKEFTIKERKEMEQLVENKLAYVGKNYTNDKIGMYHIPDEERERISKIFNHVNQ